MDNIKKPIIGKDVIESLTLGMYEDSRFIYREYIQNSADQIDKAFSTGILSSKSDGEIWVTIDSDDRIITIEDNATGIKADDIENILLNIAQSPKQRGVDKGFRGIGRLGGLGFCDSLIFETSYKSENTKSIMFWSAKKLKEIINDRSKKEQASEVIAKVTSFSQEEEAPDKHYFKVSLLNVTNDILLDVKRIREYLQMVAPVPFHPRFIYNTILEKELEKQKFSMDEYKIYVNTEQIFKAYTTSIYEGKEHNKRKIDEIIKLKYFDFNIPSGEKLLWGWYGISNFKKQIPEKGNLARGIRLRSGNIQIGSENSLVKFHREQRGNFYFFGEVHALHKNLIPNARRDYFIENETTKFLEYELSQLFRNELYQLYYFASNVRKIQKRIDKFFELKKEFEGKSKNGFSDKKEYTKYQEKLEDLKDNAKKAEKELSKITYDIKGSEDPKIKIFENATNGHYSKINDIKLPADHKKDKPKFLTDDLAKLSQKDRKLISRIFSVIDRVLTKEMADNLKLKIKEEFE